MKEIKTKSFDDDDDDEKKMSTSMKKLLIKIQSRSVNDAPDQINVNKLFLIYFV